MALINKIRQRSALVVGLVALGLALFVLGNFLKTSGRSQTLNVGKIAGESISRQEFEEKVEQIKQNYIQSTRQSPSQEEIETFRQQAWEALVAEIAFGKEYKKLGLVVSEEEVIDRVQGNNIHPEIVRAFTNPQTGKFEKERLLQYLKSIDQYPVENQIMWYQFEDAIPKERQQMKYQNLLVNSMYITKEEAKRAYENQVTKLQLKYLYIPFQSISDSTVQVSDQEIKEYLNKNRQKYEREAIANIEYISFPFLPSQQDTLRYQKEMQDLLEEFKQTTTDSSFIKMHSDVPDKTGYIAQGELPKSIANRISSLKKGDIVGPVLENGSFKIYKLSDIKVSDKYSIRASHILIKPASSSSEDDKKALTQAKDILTQLKKGQPFDQLAMMYGTDGTRSQGGDLGWFSQGKMVKEFDKAVFAFKGTGLLPEPIKTEFGYHIIKITEPKTNVTYRVATLERIITPGDETKEAALAKAESFAGMSSNAKEFKQNAAKDSSLIVLSSSGLRKTDKAISRSINAREMVRWIFNEGEIGQVSEVMETDKAFIVVLITSKTDDKEVSLENERSEITYKIRNEKKTELISNKLKSIPGTLEEIAQKYGPGASVYTMNDVSFSSTYLTNAGYAPIAIGKAFALQKEKRTQPFGDQSGVFIVEMMDKNAAPEIADYSLYKNQLNQQMNYTLSPLIIDAIKEFARVQDERYKFY